MYFNIFFFSEDKLKKCEKFNCFYFPMLYKTDKLEVAYKEIDNLPGKSFENFLYLARLLNLKF